MMVTRKPCPLSKWIFQLSASPGNKWTFNFSRSRAVLKVTSLIKIYFGEKRDATCFSSSCLQDIFSSLLCRCAFCGCHSNCRRAVHAFVKDSIRSAQGSGEGKLYEWLNRIAKSGWRNSHLNDQDIFTQLWFNYGNLNSRNLKRNFRAGEVRPTKICINFSSNETFRSWRQRL